MPDDTTMIPLVLGIDDLVAGPLPDGAHVEVYDDRGTAEAAWRELFAAPTAGPPHVVEAEERCAPARPEVPWP